MYTIYPPKKTNRFLSRNFIIGYVLIAIILGLLFCKKAEARTYDEYYDWYVQMKTESIKIYRVLIRGVKQNEGKVWKCLPDINVRYIG